MLHYRLYFMNSLSGHIDCAESLQAGDDQQAIKTAQACARDQPMELWCGARKVHRFDMPPPAELERYRARRATQEHRAISAGTESDRRAPASVRNLG